MGCIIFCRLSDDNSCEKSTEDGERQLPPVGESQKIEDGESNHGDEGRTEVGSYAEGL